MKKYCTKCGQPFDAVGREVICPSCKAAAAEETKRAAVERAKKASWNGESVPVRISGRASTIIREFGAANNLPFAAALDALLKNTPFFLTAGKAWDDITPYRSHRRDKHATETEETEDVKTVQAIDKLLKASVKAWEQEEVKQEVKQEVKPQEVTKAAKTSVKAAAKAASKASASKAAGKAASKAVSKK